MVVMAKHLYSTDQEKFTIGSQAEEMPQCLQIAFSVREHLEKLFNTVQSLSSFNFSQTGDLKRISEKLTQFILWSEPRISDATILRWNITNTGLVSCILLLKLNNCKPLRLHIKLLGAGKNKVEFWS